MIRSSWTRISACCGKVGKRRRRRQATLGLIVLYRAFVTLSADLEEIVMDILGGQEPMNNEIQLVSDGDGLAVIGNPTDVERFLLDQGLDRIPSKDLDLHRLGPAAQHRWGRGPSRFGTRRELRSLGEADRGVRESGQEVRPHGDQDSPGSATR